ncbi:L-ribulose-5-phosphate 4-epimerase [uncultured Rothia sp.]|uniref:L-ribulose-5-phosphate 4-epimerase n=1 Tax=uncultured Rothia sp. TaxID=316088 RepID=UPI0032177926
MLENLKKQVYEGNIALTREGLVVWTGGNLSAYDEEHDVIVIKPSGMLYDEMSPNDMVVVDMEGKIVEGEHGPSSDTLSHLGIYKNRPDVRSVVHTHSTYATAFAAVGREIPCVLTALADEFGGPVPCGGYAPIGGDAIGKEVVSKIGRSPAILMQQHGVFTIGSSIKDAVKAAVMVEDAARTVAIAEQIGTVTPLSDEEIESNYDRYHNRYGTSAASLGVSD